MSIKDNKEQMHEAIADMFERNSVVAKKPFDISEHEFSDSIAEIKAKSNAGSTITLDVFEKWITLNKPDAIAIAKALGVTGEDLL